MLIFCQLLNLLTITVSFFMMVYQDFNGNGSNKPVGFGGFVVSAAIYVLRLAIAYGAGAMSGLI